MNESKFNKIGINFTKTRNKFENLYFKSRNYNSWDEFSQMDEIIFQIEENKWS